MVAEGVRTARVAQEIIEGERLDAPLLSAVHRVLYEGISPTEALQSLMVLDSRPDVAPVLR